MASPDIDVAQIMLDLLDTEWNDPTVPKPEVFRLKTEDGSGTPKKNVSPGTDEYLLFSEVEERDETYADPGRNSMNFASQCYAEFATVDGRARRKEVYEEVRRICRENNNRYEAEQVLGNDLGDWDHLNYSATVPDEELFDFWVIEFSFSFGAKSRTI